MPSLFKFRCVFLRIRRWLENSLIYYIKNLTLRVDRKIRWQVFKHILLDGELYCINMDVALFKCLDGDRSKVAMGEVHERIRGTHQSAHKINCFFKYYRGCDACQWFGNRLAESYYQTMVVPRLGLGFHRSNLFVILKRASVRTSCDGLLHQVGRGHDTQKQDSCGDNSLYFEF